MSRRPRPERARPQAGRPKSGARTPSAPLPLERGRSRGVLTGMFVFAAGFAVGAVEYLVVGHTGLVWWAGITVGFFGIGATGFFLSRGTVPRPEGAIWKPEGLRPWARGAQLPEVPVLAAFYALLAVGVVGNIIAPVFFHS